jgi:hypothetical protein
MLFIIIFSLLTSTVLTHVCYVGNPPKREKCLFNEHFCFKNVFQDNVTFFCGQGPCLSKCVVVNGVTKCCCTQALCNTHSSLPYNSQLCKNIILLLYLFIMY